MHPSLLQQASIVSLKNEITIITQEGKEVAVLSTANLFHDSKIGKASFNRQLAKLLFGNEIRGNVAIRAVQMTVNFTRSLWSWPRKKLLSTVFSGFGKVPTLTNYLQSFCELKAHFFSRKKADPLTGNEQCMACKGEAVD